MNFPYFMWVIVVPDGGHCVFLMRPTRGECIAAFNSWYHNFGWWKAYRLGWRCVKVSVSMPLGIGVEDED